MKKGKLNVINKFSIEKATSHLKITLQAKNTDYGNSVEEQFDEYGLLSLLIRCDDKMSRLKNLSMNKVEQNVEDEKISDTFLDLAGYALLAYILVEEKRQGFDLSDLRNVPSPEWGESISRFATENNVSIEKALETFHEIAQVAKSSSNDKEDV